ncbi:MAG: ATP-binding protein, partial [Lachnospiraceae bacterium]|nr:ATP-binding protein [Lachnospiraceae bacterium]
SQGKILISEEVINCLNNQGTSKYDKKNRFIEITTPIVENMRNDAQLTELDNTSQSSEKVRGVMLTSVSTDTIVTTMEILNRQAVLIEVLIAVAVFGLAILIANLLERPFEKLTRAIRERKEGYTDAPIEVYDYLETEHICDAFNSLQSRMKVLDDSRDEFVSNVSHELKTPITSMKVLADSLLAMEDVPLEYYKEFMEDIAAEIEREDKIINDLLSLVKMDKTAANMNISQVDVNQLVEQVLKRLRPIARKQDIELVFESVRSVSATVDEVKLSLIVSNLVENAIKYNKEHGWVKVTLDADHQFFDITVADSGIGIPEEVQEKIFERFYRVDKSHSREIGGTGLGLAITRNAILMHRGSIKVTSVPEEGTTFVVRIPLTYIVNG